MSTKEHEPAHLEGVDSDHGIGDGGERLRVGADRDVGGSGRPVAEASEELSSRPWAPYKDASGFWRYLGNHGRANVVSIPAEVEAAIRAPLEADLREWRALFDDWRIERKEARDELAAVMAERDTWKARAEEGDRLIGLLEDEVRAWIVAGDKAQRAIIRAREQRDAALAAPATEEVQDGMR